MKSKVILSAVVAASIALSSSVFAGPRDSGPSGAQLLKVYNEMCGEADHQKVRNFVKANILSNLDVPAAVKAKGISERQGRDLCKAFAVYAKNN